MFTPSLLFRLLVLLNDVPGRPCRLGQGRPTSACWWTMASATDHPSVLQAQLNRPRVPLVDRGNMWSLTDPNAAMHPARCSFQPSAVL
ncbi:MAG: hypothetical protein J3Q66DRAFT_345112 [Benniella sp.]|nr:MAG: hypothetical protein J3Q66DRAFT_345112 [Benniella sp.]